ncbi:MAG: glycerol-3-phosphate 1-O-acyltransferase PlsY [Dehalococcoidales bacterium]
MIIAKFAAVIIGGYILGSIPFGVIISRWSARVDVRDFGSGKTGATNVLRVAGKKAALTAVLLDFFKGTLAVFLAGLLLGGDSLAFASGYLGLAAGAQVLAGVAAVGGHKWPVFLSFRGGRGVATYFGGLLALYPPAAVVGGGILFLSVGLTRYVSLSSIIGAVSALVLLLPLTLFYGVSLAYLVFTLFGAVFIIVVHRDNIARLRAGKERKIGEKVEV